jgi:hypothetical protein
VTTEESLKLNPYSHFSPSIKTEISVEVEEDLKPLGMKIKNID